MSPLSLAALNGHIKVEKHLWLFQWNMDMISNHQEQIKNTGEHITKLTDEEKEKFEMRETARKYKNQYNRYTLFFIRISKVDENFQCSSLFRNERKLKEHLIKTLHIL